MAVTAQTYDPAADLARLVDHPANPRRGDDQAVGNSIDVNGWYGAIIVQRSTGRILAGHTRRRALLAAGATSGPVIWLDCDDATADRILAADNRTAELAVWDNDALMAYLKDQQGTDLGLNGVGFTDDDLAVMIERFGSAPTLGDLVETHGEPDERSLWPVLRITLPPDQMKRYQDFAQALPGEDDTARFLIILGLAEQAHRT